MSENELIIKTEKTFESKEVSKLFTNEEIKLLSISGKFSYCIRPPNLIKY